MRRNKTKAKLAANQCAIGAGIAFPSPDLVELCAVVGFDFVTFDTEHEPMGSEQVVHCIRAAEAYDMTPIVRVARNPDVILKFMNAGAQGIHVPRCTTAQDLIELVKWTRFHPLGERTFYNRGRSGDFSASRITASISRSISIWRVGRLMRRSGGSTAASTLVPESTRPRRPPATATTTERITRTWSGLGRERIIATR